MAGSRRSFEDTEPAAGERGTEGLAGGDSGVERKYRIALVMFVALGVLVWFTVGGGAVEVFGRPVEIRLVALLVIGSFALRTFLAHQANRIRHGGHDGPPKDL